MGDQPLMLVTVGTDHHLINRLMDWVDEYATTRTGRARFIVQYGYSRAPKPRTSKRRRCSGSKSFKSFCAPPTCC